MQNALPNALMKGAGRFRGKANVPKMSAKNRITRIKRRSQKFENRRPSAACCKVPSGVVTVVRIVARTTTIRKQMIAIIRETKIQLSGFF